MMTSFNKIRIKRIIEDSDRKISVAAALLEQAREALYDAENGNRIARVLLAADDKKS